MHLRYKEVCYIFGTRIWHTFQFPSNVTWIKSLGEPKIYLIVKQGILFVNRIDHRRLYCKHASQFPLCVWKYVGRRNSCGKYEINPVSCQCMKNVNESGHTQVHMDTMGSRLPCISKDVGLCKRFRKGNSCFLKECK